MFAWTLAIFFGVMGAIAGNIVPIGSTKPSAPLYMLGFGVVFAILGALIGGSMDIVNVIKERTSKPADKSRDRLLSDSRSPIHHSR